MKVRRKDSLSEILLGALEKTVDGYVRLEDFLSNTHIYAKGYERILKKSSFSQALNRLRKQGLVESSVINDEILIKLTQIGKDFLELEVGGQQNWDGKWRVVIFDVPEQKRIVRNLFRRNLKRWGFKQLQKSVWISKRNIYDKLVAYAKDLQIEKWVAVIECTKVSDQSWDKFH
jgi:CRISPR-associated endonuclease Cas2